MYLSSIEDLPPELTLERRGSIRILTLNRPDRLNSVNEPLHDALAGVWPLLAQDRDARAVVLTGAGDAFSAGGDISWFSDLSSDADLRRRTLDQGRKIIDELLRFPLPIVAAVNGPATGLGCSLAVMCDIVLMAEGAFYADPHVSVGLVAADGGAPAWPVLMSILKAKEYLYTGDRIPAEEAVRLGLANRVVPRDSLHDEALALAERLAGLPPQALQATKRTINLHMERAMRGLLEYAFAAEMDSFTTPEHQAAVARFTAKRQEG